jgi:cyanophycinase
MSSGEKDTSVHYFRLSVEPVCNNPVVNLDFTAETVNNRSRLDSLEKAKLIFITGGQQTRFMNIVLNTPVYDAIHKAYRNGAMIAGTSAGAAVMSEQMITGSQLLPEAKGKEGFTMIKAGNVEFSKGLGLITTAIIDQHFIVRSRYNRLLTSLQTFPKLVCVGIDEVRPENSNVSD